MWDRRALVSSVHDGDTITVSLDQGLGITLENVRIRLFGVFAPELKQTGGTETKQFVIDWLAKYTTSGTRFGILITTIRTPVSDKEVVTLGRYVCSVESLDHSHNLNVDVSAFVKINNYSGGVGT